MRFASPPGPKIAPSVPITKRMAAARTAMTAAIEVVPLGGLGEFGRNLLWLKCGESSILVDVGVSFPDETFPGIDRIAPDLSALSGVRIDAVLLTHGHEDHIGGLPLLREISPAPVYGLPFTLAMARRRLEDADSPLDGLIEARPREKMRAGEFAFTYFRVSHSVPDSAAILIEAGGLRIFHSGDFKLDPDPPDGETTDHEGIAAAAGEGVDLALVDSTNAERPGRALSERLAGEGLAAVFAGAPRRIILTTFSSHVARISQAVESATRLRRRVTLLGRSMRTVAEIAQRLRRLSLPSGILVPPLELSGYPPEQLLCLTSGSQGEPFSALYRLALDEHADLRLGAEDLVMMPVHGERRMLAAAAEIAQEFGVARDRIALLDNGDRLTLGPSRFEVEPGAAPAGRVYLDSRPELVEPSVVRDRRQLAEEGFVVVFVAPDARSGEITVVSRGVATAEADIAVEVRKAGRAVLARATPEERNDPEWLRAEIALAAKRVCRRSFDIRPVIVPVIV